MSDSPPPVGPRAAFFTSSSLAANAVVSSSASSSSDEIQAISSMSELESVQVTGSDKYYVPRKKDLAKKEAERKEREREEEERRDKKHRIKDVGKAKEQLDFSDDEEEEDAPGGLNNKAAPTASKTQSSRPAQMQQSILKDKLSAETKVELADMSDDEDEPAAAVTHKKASAPKAVNKAAKEEISDEEDEETGHGKSNTVAAAHASTTSTTNVAPLINPDAATFFWQRLSITVTAGLQWRFPDEKNKPPWYLYVLSAAAFFMSVIIIIIFCLLINAGSLTQWTGCVTAGVIAACIHLLLHLPSLSTRKVSQQIHIEQPHNNNTNNTNSSHTEEAETQHQQPKHSITMWDFTQTWDFLFPLPYAHSPSISMIQLLLHTAVYGAVIGLSTFVFDFNAMSTLYAPLSPLYLIFAYLCISLSVYPLLSKSAVEPNQWRGDDHLINLYTRPVFLAVVLLIALVVRCSATTASIDTASYSVYQASMILLLFFPLFSIIGLLPNLEALLFYCLEQANVLLLAASLSSSHIRGLLTCLLAASCVFITTAIYTTTSTTAVLFFTLAVGCLLSHDLLPATTTMSAVLLPSTKSRLYKLGLTLVVLAVIILGFVLYGLDVDVVSGLQSLRNPPGQWIWDGVLVAAWLSCLAHAQYHQPYICRLFRNPFHSSFSLPTSNPTTSAYHYYLFVLRLFLLVYLATRLTTDTASTLDFSGYAWFASLCMLRQFRHPWQNLYDSLHAMILLFIVDQFAGQTWLSLDYPIRLFFCAALCQRWTDLGAKAEFVLTLTYTSNTVPKLQTRHPGLFAVLAWVLLPYHVCLVVCSAVLALPIYPVLGASIFLPSFPRPQRIFPALIATSPALDNQGHTQTHFFYQHLAEVLQPLLHRLVVNLHLSSHTPHVLLLRAEPYTCLVSVLAAGYDHMEIVIKGMELEMTSCHTAETLHMDTVITEHDRVPQRWSFPLHTYQPVSMPQTPIPLSCYVPHVSSLVGVLDDKQNLDLIRQSYYKQLILSTKTLCSSISTASQSSLSLKPQWSLKVAESDMQSAQQALPVSFFAHVFPKETDRNTVLPLIASMYALMYVVPPPSSRPLSATTLYNVYAGKLPLSIASEQLKHEAKHELREVMQRALRISVKLVYDAYAELTTQMIEQDDMTAINDYIIAAQSIQQQVQIGKKDDDILPAIQQGKQQFFAIAPKEEASAALSIHSVSMASLSFTVFRCNYAAFASIWTGMLVELLYLGNDDDERYSIQANEWILRNMSVQAGEAPFGYASYSSGPLLISTM